MAKYYVDNESLPNGDHEVHVQTCAHLPVNRKLLGEFTNCFEAVRAAKQYYVWANGCYWCSRPCHLK